MKFIEVSKNHSKYELEQKIKELENTIMIQNWTINLYQEVIDSRKELEDAIRNVESD